MQQIADRESPGKRQSTKQADRDAKPSALASLPGTLFAEQPALQLIYDTAPIGLAFLSPDCRYMHINQRLTEICGISVEEHLGRTVRECVPALADSVEAIVRSIMTTGEPVIGVEVAGQRPNQNEDRSWITYWHPLRDADGRIIGINVAAEEITERKRAEAALRASERQFHTLADAIPQLVWMAESDGRIFWFNSHWYEYTGGTPDDLKAHDWGAHEWQTILAPALLPKARRRWVQSLRSGTALEMELSLRGKNGQYRSFLTRVVPLRDARSKIYRWIGTHVDITDQKRREAHTRFVIDELSHRTKNLFAVVMAVANQTARHASDVAQYKARFSERLEALAHCHDLLVKDHWQGASLHELIAAQMRPFNEASTGRVEVDGPLVVLKPDAVQHLGLALHELATNASKHGALSGPHGKISIHWRLGETDNQLRIDWREREGPAVTPPRRRGFGHVVIQQIVPRALNGRGKLDFAPEGVNWRFEFAPRLEV